MFRGGFLINNSQTVNAGGSSPIVLVCEHASRAIPAAFHNLGLSPEASTSHAAWDPGALAVAQHMSKALDAVLVAATVSRLVYDCNRPEGALDAMPARSEVIEVPGNKDLSQQDKDARFANYYLPFHAEVAAQITQRKAPLLVTIHSFTPVYHGERRSVEIGVLHDADTRLADAMLSCAAQHTQHNVQRNAPYGPEHGVTHMLKEHGLRHGHPNVMLEIRNDLIRTEAEQRDMAEMIAAWLADAFARMGTNGDVRCGA